MPKERLDIAGVKIEIGDTIAFSGSTYTALHLAKVDDFTPKKVRIVHGYKSTISCTEGENSNIVIVKKADKNETVHTLPS